MDDFKGYRYTTLEPGDQNVPLRAKFAACSVSTANDGAVPYGSTLANCTAFAHFGDDTTYNGSTMIQAVELSSQIATAYLPWSSN